LRGLPARKRRLLGPHQVPNFRDDFLSLMQHLLASSLRRSAPRPLCLLVPSLSRKHLRQRGSPWSVPKGPLGQDTQYRTLSGTGIFSSKLSYC
jgi:hypothetical protein